MPFRMAAILLILALEARPAPAGETIERVLAVIDDRPVFLSDVRTVAELDDLDRSEALERVIDEMLLSREAARLPQGAGGVSGEAAPPDPVPGDAARRRAVLRRAAIRRYASFRFRPQIRVDDEAVRRAYAERWGGSTEPPAFERVASELREELLVRAVDERVKAWVRDLRASAHVRYNGPDPEPVRAR
jgi:hypothetical protein